MPKTDAGSCLGCLGNLVILTFFGSMFFGGGVVMRVGGLGFSLGRDPIDYQNIINYHWADLENNKKVTEEAVKKLHTQLNQGQCQDIFDQASEILKKNQSKSQVTSFCQNLTLNLGTQKSSQLTDWWGQPTDKDSEKYILTRYITTFSKASVRETFVWLVKDSKPELVNYEISPITMPVQQFVPSKI
ncbi:hypothetical protein NIES2100_43330 [Calothrix sp. NIES-2100]|uniref:hypothetical protein n=1 Tax=Calothrix sp. NIES-2100 TaxID=1954172 RepID=UPI000B5FDBFD|nr:hypothetical protein NIES2100_43330 [Calothrix sp. NIES-2100]